jgi:hypothetical protein
MSNSDSYSNNKEELEKYKTQLLRSQKVYLSLIASILHHIQKKIMNSKTIQNNQDESFQINLIVTEIFKKLDLSSFTMLVVKIIIDVNLSSLL